VFVKIFNGPELSRNVYDIEPPGGIPPQKAPPPVQFGFISLIFVTVAFAGRMNPLLVAVLWQSEPLMEELVG
jgi:hypothetical protein